MAREMKDSGVEWIGEIPACWRTTRFKYMHSGTNVGESIDKDYWSENSNDTVFYTAGLKPISTTYKDFPSWKYVNHNDLLLARNGTPYVYMPIVKSVYSDHIIRVTIKNDYDKRYAKYCLQHSILAENVNVVSIATWSASLWNKQILPLPDSITQQKIADFLDSKCSTIDSTITDTQASIEEYKKLKQAIITKAVTKGIRGDRPMKDSSIEWIGEIPADWEVNKVKHILRERAEHNNPVKTKERLSLSIDKGVTLYSEKTTNLDRFKDDFTQYKLAYEGDIVLNSMNMIVGAVGVSKYFGCVSPVYYTLYDTTPNHTTTKYCEYLFRTPIMKSVFYSLGEGIMAIDRGEGRVNTCRLKVPRDAFKSLLIPIPNISEQQEIADYLDQKCTAIDQLIKDKEQLITELEAYKKTLIYDYITGKKEVC